MLIGQAWVTCLSLQLGVDISSRATGIENWGKGCPRRSGSAVTKGRRNRPWAGNHRGRRPGDPQAAPSANMKQLQPVVLWGRGTRRWGSGLAAGEGVDWGQIVTLLPWGL